MSGSRPRRVFPVTGAVIVLGLSAAVVLWMLVDAAVRGGIGTAVLLAPWPLLVLWAVYVVGIASDIRADGEGVQVQNLIRRTRIPWGRVRRIALRWQLEIHLDDGSVVRCFGGPTTSRPRRLGVDRQKEDAAEASQDGLALVRRLRQESAPSPRAEVTHGWDMPAVAVLAALVVWAVAAVIVTI
jgi:hypothetical protein